jgi:parvulin-like peptidyl-prolyl isomerase
MRYRLITIALAAVGLMVAGCDSKGNSSDNSQEQAQAESPDKADAGTSGSAELPFEATGAVATVNGKEISADAYNEEVKKMTQGMPGKMPYPVAKRFQTRTLDRLIDKQLIEAKIESAGIEVTDKEISNEFDRVKERLSERIPDGKDFQWFLDRQGMDQAQFKDQIAKQLRLEKLLKKKEGISVSDEEAKKYYQNNKSEFEKKERVKARHILVKTSPDAGTGEVEGAKKKAQKLADQARSGDKDFATLAEENSEGPSARRGGDLGYFTKDRMMPAFSEAAFNMKEGEISDPVKTSQGYHVIKKEGTKPAETTSFEDAKSDIVQKLERKQLRKAMKSFTEELRKQAKISKNTDNIKLNVEKGSGRGGRGGGLGAALKKKMQQKAKQKAAEQESAGGSESGGESGSSESESGSAGSSE